jgi:hypothetical protein
LGKQNGSANAAGDQANPAACHLRQRKTDRQQQQRQHIARQTPQQHALRCERGKQTIDQAVEAHQVTS